MAQITERFRQIPGLANQEGIADVAQILEEVIEQLRLDTASRAQQIAQQIIQLLLPEQNNRPAPGAAIIAIKCEAVLEIETETELKFSTGGNEYTFTPIYKSQMYPVAIRYIGAHTHVFHFAGEGLPQKKSLTKKMPQGLCLLGLELLGSCDTLEGMQIFFPGLNQTVVKHLSLAKFHFEGQVYRLTKANYPETEQEYAHTTCDKEYLLLNKKRRDIAAATAQLGVFRLEAIAESYSLSPFKEKDFGINTKEQQHPLKWGQLVLPASIDPVELSTCPVSVNALPIFNVFSNIKEKVPGNNQNRNLIVPIPASDNEVFLALGRVWTDTKHPYWPRALFPDRLRTYQLGVRNPVFLGALDIPGLIQTLHSTVSSANPAALASLSRNSRDTLQQYHTSLQTIEKEWQTISNGLQQVLHETYYLTLYPSANDQVVYVETWRTNTALYSTLLPTDLELSHSIIGCNNIKMLVPPDKLTYGEQHLNNDPLTRLSEIFPALSKNTSL